MTVVGYQHSHEAGKPPGNLVGQVRWAAAPGAEFQLEIAPDGRLVEWRAKADPGKTLSARQLRAAPIGAMERALRRTVSLSIEVTEQLVRERSYRRGTHADWQEMLSREKASLADFVDRPRTGPTGRSDRSYAAVAALYTQAVARGERTPVLSVAAQMQLGERTVRNYLFKARERGLLTSSGRGRAGGQLTDKAKELLSGNDQAS